MKKKISNGDYSKSRINEKFRIFYFIFAENWVVSSVGLEHYLDRVGVTGSNPVQPTNLCLPKVFE